MALNNDLNIKAGLDTVTQEEHDDIKSTFAALADILAAYDSASVMADAADFEPDNLIDNVFYINLSPNTESLDDSWRQRLKSVTENVGMNTGFFNDRAFRTLSDTVAGGQIPPKDDIKKGNYFAKVINHLVTNAPWIATHAVMLKDKNFTTKKEDFHKALISHFTQGLNLPNNVVDKFEGFLANVQNTIKNSSTPPRDSISIYIYAVVYVKDEVRQEWRPYVRTFSFKPSQSLSNYIKDKNGKSAGSEVNVDFQYVQFDGAFNNDLFESSAKPALMQIRPGATTSIKPLGITFDSN
ncbi:peptidase cysteine serine trypsin [Fusarium pseudoanthophilum]|uniref:Peptidase cysteine serine trypsin n=1 Tax=Fusarium pseudoanthophilum TaxID=48495 RepID=A0A8H5L5P4_9HYPO|nr:peptidase cysteine serine trypsin [Fusarium pseudoanthophilum]